MATTKGNKKNTVRKVASLDLDSFVETGLVDDIDAEVTRARYIPNNYGGKQDKFGLALRVELEGFGDSEGTKIDPIIYSAGDLKFFVPSMDGEDPAGLSVEQYADLANGEGSIDDDELEDCEGIFALQVGKVAGIAKSSNLQHFIEALNDAGFDREKLLSGDASELEGMRAHWNRLPQKARKGMQGGDSGGDAGGRQKTILLPTEIYKDKAGKSKNSATSASTKAKTKARPAASDDDEPEEEASSSKKSKPGSSSKTAASSDLDSRVEEILSDAIEASKSKTLRRENLSAIIIKNLTGSDRANATKLVSDINWIGDSARPWDYDRKAKTLSAKDEDMEEEELEEEETEEEEEESED